MVQTLPKDEGSLSISSQNLCILEYLKHKEASSRPCIFAVIYYGGKNGMFYTNL